MCMGGFNNLLIDGKGLLNKDGSVNLLVNDRLHFLDDLVNNGLVDDGSILDGLRSSGGDFSGREIGRGRSLGEESGIVLHDGGSGLGGQGSISYFGGNDFSFSHWLHDFINIELFSLSFNDWLDLKDFLGFVDLMNDGCLFDSLDHDWGFSDIDYAGLSGCNRSDEAESLAFQLIGDSISVQVGESSGSRGLRGSSLQLVGDSVAVQVIGRSNSSSESSSLKSIGDSISVRVGQGSMSGNASSRVLQIGRAHV